MTVIGCDFVALLTTGQSISGSNYSWDFKSTKPRCFMNSNNDNNITEYIIIQCNIQGGFKLKTKKSAVKCCTTELSSHGITK